MSESAKRASLRSLPWALLLAALALAVWVSWWPGQAQSRAQGLQLTSSPAEEVPGEVSGEVPGVSPEVYGRVQRLREALCLQAQDLGALGVTQAQAESVLVALRTWAESNGARLDEVDDQVRSRERELREAMRKVHVGPRDESLLRQAPRLQEEVRGAEADRGRLLDEAGRVATASLNATQQSLWLGVRRNVERHVPGTYRYVPNLSDREVSDLLQGLRAQALGVEPKWPSRNALRQPMAELAQQNLTTHLPGVQAAEARVLPPPAPPPPPEVSEDPEGVLVPGVRSRLPGAEAPGR